MCGIGGFAGTGDDAILQRMTAALARRGPDDNGVYRHEHIGLAFGRLAIIDLSVGGHQPKSSASGSTVIAFNGEIYNFKKLRADLESAGAYHFTSESDTEVILALYETHGEAAFAMLDGMFAIALYDKKTRVLFLVRDRMGKKPLYWGIFGGTLVFGSELKVLTCHPAVETQVDPEALKSFLTYEYVPTPKSIWKGIHKLQPASYLRYEEGKAPKQQAYWRVPTVQSDIPLGDALVALDTKLSDAVSKRLVSDVPLGVFLSGGIDSSTVAYYAQKTSGERLKTFSIGFTEEDHDESGYAEQVARALGVEHTVEHFSAKKCIELIPEIFSYVDEPLADYSLLPTYLLSGFTKKHVTVALGGDGADELFAGYPTFEAEKFVGLYNVLPKAIRRSLIEPLVQALPVNRSYMSFDFKAKKFLEGADSDPRYRHQKWLGAFSREESEMLLTEQYREKNFSPYSMLDKYFTSNADKNRYFNEILWSYARTYLMDEVLVKVDRASMAHGLEVRAPFLDTALVEFASSLPYSYKYRGTTGKYILKQLMKDKLPSEIVNRKKKGFSVPMAEWLRGDLKTLSHDLLSKTALEKSGVFEYAPVQKLLDEHESGVRDNRKKLWTLMTFQMWHRNWMN